MNNFLNKMERKLGRYAIPRLTTVLMGCYLIGYVLQLFAPSALSFMYLDPYYIFQGQIWRIITWILVPPSSISGYNAIFALIMLFFYFSIGSALERTWGDFRYNLYIFGGLFISLISAFISYGVVVGIYGQAVSFGSIYSTYYICMSILMAFAMTFPDMKVMLWFVIPLKVKWLGIVYGAFIAYDVFTYLRGFSQTRNPLYILLCVSIIASVANFIIFFFMNRGRTVKNRMRSRNFTRKYNGGDSGRYSASQKKSGNGEGFGHFSNGGGAGAGADTSGRFARHRCEICGRTDISDPDLEFRFCSKCDGAHEYCMDHLYTHEHVKN